MMMLVPAQNLRDAKVSPQRWFVLLGLVDACGSRFFWFVSHYMVFMSLHA